MGQKVEVEIERKFLLGVGVLPYEQEMRLAGQAARIVQGYLFQGGRGVVRVRTVENIGLSDLRDREVKAYLTVKGAAQCGGLVQRECEHEMDHEQAILMLDMLPEVLVKRRYTLEDGWVLDVLPMEAGSPLVMVFAEHEYASEEEARADTLPGWMRRRLEVTGDLRYRMSAMVRRQDREKMYGIAHEAYPGLRLEAGIPLRDTDFPLRAS